MTKLFVNYYLSLFALLIICFFVSYSCLVPYWHGSVCDDWLKDFSFNLLAELIGIILVLFLVNRTIDINQQKERNRFKKIALRPLKMVLSKQVYLLFNMFKASVEVKPVKEYEKIQDLFDDTYFNEVGFLDLLQTSPVLTVGGQDMDWLDYLYSEFCSLRTALCKVVDRYSFYLDSEVVDLLEEVADAGIISFITVIREAKQCHHVEFRGDLLSECQSLLIEYTNLFIKLLEVYNQSVTSKNQITIDSTRWNEMWANNVRPKIGESRIGIASNT